MIQKITIVKEIGSEGAPTGSCKGSDCKIETKSGKIKIYLPRIEKITNIFAKDRKDKHDICQG